MIYPMDTNYVVHTHYFTLFSVLFLWFFSSKCRIAFWKKNFDINRIADEFQILFIFVFPKDWMKIWIDVMKTNFMDLFNYIQVQKLQSFLEHFSEIISFIRKYFRQKCYYFELDFLQIESMWIFHSFMTILSLITIQIFNSLRIFGRMSTLIGLKIVYYFQVAHFISGSYNSFIWTLAGWISTKCKLTDWKEEFSVSVYYIIVYFLTDNISKTSLLKNFVIHTFSVVDIIFEYIKHPNLFEAWSWSGWIVAHYYSWIYLVRS